MLRETHISFNKLPYFGTVSSNKDISSKVYHCQRTDKLGGWHPRGLIVHQQRYWPGDSDKYVGI